MFWVLCFGFWVLGFVFWVLGFVFCVLCFVFWVLCFVFGFCSQTFLGCPERPRRALKYAWEVTERRLKSVGRFLGGSCKVGPPLKGAWFWGRPLGGLEGHLAAPGRLLGGPWEALEGPWEAPGRPLGGPCVLGFVF